MEGEKDQAKTDQKKDWAEMSDVDEDNEHADDAQKKEEDKEKPKKKIPAKKGFKNDRGDYVVTTIDIPDMRTGMRKEGGNAAGGEETDSDSVYDDEDDTKEQQQAATEEKKEESKYQPRSFLDLNIHNTPI